MNTTDENSSAIEAKRQIGMCCETLCDKSIVEDYITELENELARMQKLLAVYDKLHNKLVHEYPEKSGSFFICGHGGKVDSLGMPDHIQVCPQYGSDGFAVYKKYREYSAPEW